MISEDFIRLIQVFGSIEENVSLPNYLTDMKFNTRQHNKAIYKKLEDIYKNFEDKIEKNPKQDI
jgi:hypothetical protein